MGNWMRWGAAGLALVGLTLSGCDTQKIAELEEGVATEADVRARFGEPEKVWEASDMQGLSVPAAVTAPGARTFEYNRQPAGKVNYQITIGSDGKMSALRQVLTSANFAQVQPGMAMEPVRKLLGKPMKITPYPLKQEVHYDWRYQDSPSTTLERAERAVDYAQRNGRNQVHSYDDLVRKGFFGDAVKVGAVDLF